MRATAWFFESRIHHGTFYATTLSDRTCPGWQYRHRCSRVNKVKEETKGVRHELLRDVEVVEEPRLPLLHQILGRNSEDPFTVVKGLAAHFPMMAG